MDTIRAVLGAKRSFSMTGNKEYFGKYPWFPVIKKAFLRKSYNGEARWSTISILES